MKYEKRGEPMPMAVITGYDPIVYTVSCTRTPPNVDEFHIAGALRGEPLEMVKCKTIDVEVPATSEVVFEGYIQPAVREMEGGFEDSSPGLKPLRLSDGVLYARGIAKKFLAWLMA